MRNVALLVTLVVSIACLSMVMATEDASMSSPLMPIMSLEVGVNDDYMLNADVSFACPLPPPLTSNATDDAPADDDYYGALLPPNYPAFTFFYCWMTVFTVLPLLYFAFNNRLFPVGTVKPFLPEVIHDEEKKKTVDNSHCHQTGFTTHAFGHFLYYSLLLTLVGIQMLLLLLVMCYYFILNHSVIKEDSPDLSMAWNPFEDAPQSLYAFIIAWSACFAFVAFFKRPSDLFASCMRRCEITDATYIAIFMPDSRGVELLVKDGVEWNVTKIFTLFHHQFDALFAFLFSEISHEEPGQTVYCPVLLDENQVKYIEFRMRRYNLDPVTQSFQPAHIYTDMQDRSMDDIKVFIETHAQGLTSDLVTYRQAKLGYNTIMMEKANFLHTLSKEFSRIFYVYQNFMAWTWFNYSYWHMGIVNTLVYITGGLTVAYVNYSNAKRLEDLCHITGEVEVFRDGRFMKIDQQLLVMGDVLKIQPGMAYCDMLVLSGEAVVDESSLTGESMPIAKVAVDISSLQAMKGPGQTIDEFLLHHKHNMILAGTTVINQDRMSSIKENETVNVLKVVTDEQDGVDSSAKATATLNRARNTALVMKTGSYTMKGEMLREMFYGKPKKFKFDMEVSVVMLILLCYSIFAFSMTIYFLNSQPIYGFFFAIYVVASALPPLLPTVFIVSEGIAAERLFKNKKIAVTDPHRILMAGKVKVAFFDKTGTLTEQGLDFHSVVSTSRDTTNKTHQAVFDDPTVEPSGALAVGMSVCHNLKQIVQQGDVTLLGNAIDRKMFEVTRCVLESGYGTTHDLIVHQEKDTKHQTKYAILKQFDFDSKRKTQSVLIRNEAQPHLIYVFTKGTGEALKSISFPETVPVTFDDAVTASAKSGVYQISMAFKIIHLRSEASTATSTEVSRSPLHLTSYASASAPATHVDSLETLFTWPRDDIEKNMHFLGFINFTNPMKVKTPSVISELKAGDIRTVMISGDHVLTALYIARLSGMVHTESRMYLGKHFHRDTGHIDWVDEATGEAVTLPERFHEKFGVYGDTEYRNVELALIGHVWDEVWAHDRVYATQLAHFVRVIGRCSPHTKISIVECFNRQGFLTLMCGDGGNDCGALKTAHVGVALSDAEASVVSSFTSLDKDIGSVVEILKEGRCTLSSAFASYRYMIMYGQIETINQMVCAWFAVTFSEWCWVFMDGFWVITMAFSLPYANVAEKLAPNRPTSSILGPHTLSSTLGVLLINFLFVVLALGLLNQQDWYACRKWGDSQSIADVTAIGDNYESSVVFIISGYQYITSAIAYNFGFQHRAAFWTNWRFWFFATAWTVIHFTMVLYPSTLSCFFRVNCENDDVLRGATSADLVPIQNPWHHTLMPLAFRHDLLILMIMNGVAVVLWEVWVVNGRWVNDLCRRVWRPFQRSALLGGVGYLGASGISGESGVTETTPSGKAVQDTNNNKDKNRLELIRSVTRGKSGVQMDDIDDEENTYQYNHSYNQQEAEAGQM